MNRIDPEKKRSPHHGLRLNPEDLDIIGELRTLTGAASTSDILRMGLRALRKQMRGELIPVRAPRAADRVPT